MEGEGGEPCGLGERRRDRLEDLATRLEDGLGLQRVVRPHLVRDRARARARDRGRVRDRVRAIG